MSKINLVANLKSKDDNITINTIGIKQKNKIIYKANDILVTILINDKDKLGINRLSKDYELNLYFDINRKTKSIYKDFELKKELELDTKCQKLIIKKNEILIEYILEENDFSYSLKIGGKYDN